LAGEWKTAALEGNAGFQNCLGHRADRKIRQTNMSKRKRKLTTAEKAEKKRRRMEYMTIFVRGKQRRVRRPPTIAGMDVEEFILRNADPIWLHQNELWEYMELPVNPVQDGSDRETVPQESTGRENRRNWEEDDDIPF
jgi:uncharacterized protein YnzC (UPF0291/DUF896 family)